MGVNNPDSISGRDDDATMMPDQQAASGQSYGGQGSLLDAIGSMQGGAVPNEAILSLLQGPSQGQRYAQAAAGGVAFMRGQPNPVSEIIGQQQRQQMGIVQVLQKMQEREDLKAYRQGTLLDHAAGRKETRDLHTQNMLEKFTADMIASNDPEANLLGWTTRRTQMAAAGFPFPEAIAQGLARKDLPKEVLAQAVSLTGTVPFPELRVMYKQLRPEHEQLLMLAKGSDDYRKGLGLESKLEESYKADEHAWKGMAARLAGQREERLYESEKRQGRALEATELRGVESARHNRVMEGNALRSQERADRSQDRQDRALTLAERKADAQRAEWDRKIETKDQKNQRALEVMTGWLDQLDDTADRINAKNYLTKSAKGPISALLSMDPQPAAAKFNRDWNHTDVDWRMWSDMLQGGGIGFERSVLNDIGPRAMAAFKGIMRFFDDPPTREGIAQASKFMRKEIAIARGRAPEATQEIVYKSAGKTFVEKWKKGDPLPPDAEILTVDGEKSPMFGGR